MTPLVVSKFKPEDTAGVNVYEEKTVLPMIRIGKMARPVKTDCEVKPVEI